MFPEDFPKVPHMCLAPLVSSFTTAAGHWSTFAQLWTKATAFSAAEINENNSARRSG